MSQRRKRINKTKRLEQKIRELREELYRLELENAELRGKLSAQTSTQLGMFDDCS
jgi:regulator of replication initiation timing